MHIIIIGSGVAGVSFAEKYRALSADDQITLVTKEHDGYYSRPLLSRGFSKLDIEQSIILKPFASLSKANIEVLGDTEVTAINRSAKTLAVSSLGQEKTLSYDKLILAQGSSAFIPPPFRPYDKLFFCLNSLGDLKILRKTRQDFLTQGKKPNWAIIGGGLIGCELASDLAAVGDEVTLFHAMNRLMERQLVDEDSVLLLNVLQDSGVKVLLNQDVQGLSQEGDKVCVTTDEIAKFDGLVIACGFKPRTELAELAGLKTGRGIKVNQCFQTSDESIYALGDVAELPNGKLYAFVLPIRNQALWLAEFLTEQNPSSSKSWVSPIFSPKAKVHGFEAEHPYNA